MSAAQQPVMLGDAAEDEDWGAYGEAGAFQPRTPMKDLTLGQELQGIVQSVRPFGCFVDVGAEQDGLVHISRISDGFVDDIHEFVRAGQEVTVWVSQVAEDGKLGLSMAQNRVQTSTRAMTKDISAFRALTPDQWLTGIVARIADYGIFVEVTPPDGGPPAQGLVHVTQIREGFVDNPAAEAHPGQEVQVRVISVDTFSGRLGLSMREGSANSAQAQTPLRDVSAFEGLGPKEWIVGRVHHTTTFGIIVEVTPPAGGDAVQGLVHLTQIREGSVEDPASEVDVGQEVRVRVLSVDAPAGRIALSMVEPK